MVVKSRALLPSLVKEGLVLSAEGPVIPNRKDKEGLRENWLNGQKLGLEHEDFPRRLQEKGRSQPVWEGNGGGYWGKVIFKVRNCSLCVFFMVYEESDAA